MHKNKVAAVTGAGRGIGRAIALELAKNGTDIAVIYSSSEEHALSAAEEIRAMGRRAELYRCDVSDFAAAKETVAAIVKAFGRLDILVNNAGITRDGLVLTMSEENYDLVMDTNLKGAFNMIRHAFSPMMRQRSGRIINISSVSGLMGNAGQANYSSAKAGLIGLTKTVAKELASRGVTCNAVAPGFVESDMTAKLSENILESAKSSIPLGRLGKPEDIAHAVSFLASDFAEYITGEVIKVDGGLYI